MRNFFRYLLVLSVLAIGFYGASQHPLNDDLPHAMETVEWDEPVSTSDPADSGPAMPRQTPLAVLIDTDRSQTNETPTDSHITVNKLPEITRPQAPETTPVERISSPSAKNAPHKNRSGGKPKARPGPSPDETSADMDSADDQNAEVEPTGKPAFQAATPDERSPAPPPADRPRDAPTATAPDSEQLGFPLPKLDPRPGDRFAVRDPKESSRADRNIENWGDNLCTKTTGEPAKDEMPSFTDQKTAQVANSESTAPSAPPQPSSNTTKHTIEVGDTLPKLAAQYLGNSQLYEAIYLANRDVLGDPRLLPIGITLRIPTKSDLQSDTQSDSQKPTDEATSPKPSRTPPADDPLEDLFREPASPPQTSSNLEPIPPQALPPHQYEAWRQSIR
jgi:nucleoid-associated protein YgaU